MEDRRTELDLTWDEVAERSGRSKETLFQVAKGRVPQSRTRTAIDRGLGWKRGSVDAVLAGGEPTKIDEPAPGPEQIDGPSEFDELRDMAERTRQMGEDAIAFAEGLMERIDRLDHSGEHRAAQ